ncbi:hypothetical protein NIES37_46310 [Tolypothrix tenuis PCC 7101]|uniref:Uncharacterized protein n=1 Tax=Tolypothrix tenuis PCC 7101 TaxID=231146 RepID=A0A1Z4N4K4_9CYAN|nr:hypothetical protein NIES37_46310 [Tolypothrix tenuis PCC 7101]BAZ75441.1 hypothetical protein NIES50_40240 [Aulosira laxa NIES-50]
MEVAYSVPLFGCLIIYMPEGGNVSNRQAQSLEEKITKLVKCAQRRNIRKTVVAGALIALFALIMAYDIYQQPKDTLAIIGSGVIILALLLDITVIWWKLHIPKSELSAFPPTQFPDKWKQRLTHQARMLRLVWLWYLLPLFLGLFIYLLSVYDASSGAVIIPLLIQAVACIGIWQFNFKVAKQIERDRDAWFGNLRTV